MCFEQQSIFDNNHPITLNTMGHLRLVVTTAMLLVQCWCFIIQLHQGVTKCFTHTIEDNSAVQIMFGVPRPTQDNCKLMLTIHYLPQDPNAQHNNKTLDNLTMFCHDRNPGDLIVFKYADHLEHSSNGRYRVCVVNLDDYGTNKTMIELKITSDLVPASSENYVQSSQLLTLSTVVQSIKQKISWSYALLEQAEKLGDKMNAIIKLAYVQIGCLIAYAVVWLVLAQSTIICDKK